MSETSDWPVARREGFALAAAVCDDGDARLAAEGLAASAGPALLGAARELAALSRGERRRWVRRRLGRAALPRRAPQGASPRALALIASRVAPELGKRWLAGAPLPRAGFVAEPALVELLARIAARADREPLP